MYLQGRNRGADIESGSVDAIEEREGGVNWESSTDMHILLLLLLLSHFSRVRLCVTP